MSKILVVNPNSTRIVTEQINIALECFRSPKGPEIICETLSSGPPGIETQAHVDGISEKMISWLNENPRLKEVDALVLACFSDPGLFALREVLSVPVIGCAESAYHTASALGEKFGVISILSRAIPRHLRQIKYLGLEHKLAQDIAIEVNVVNLSDEKLTFQRMLDVGKQLIEEHHAQTIIMGCAGMARYRARLEDKLGVNVIDPTQAGLSVALSFVLPRMMG
jgi:Asp/Glu/hydantoin racemase